MKHIVVGALVFFVATLAQANNGGSDSIDINRAALWPKPANPVAAGSQDSPALKVVQGFFTAYGNGDLDGMRQFVSDDVEWHIPGRHKLAGTKRGIDEFTAFFAFLGKARFNAEVMILAATILT